MMQHRIAAGAIVEDQDRVLLVRHQRPGRYDFWVAPGGGVKGDEPLRSAAIREVREETGLLVEPLDLAYVEEFFEPEMRHCKFWFTARLTGGELGVARPEAMSEFIVGAAWLTQSEMSGKTIFPPVLLDRYWSDSKRGFPAPLHLQLRRMESW